MNLLKKLFGGTKSAEPEAEVVTLTGSGDFGLEVMSVAFYEDNLERICGPRTDQGENRIVPARLVLEDTNPKDPEAVRVEVNDLQVGYLNRSFAHQYRQQLKQTGHPRAIGVCSAKITGGWKRKSGKRAGLYEVWLDIPEH
jgi:hypothetical protein